MKKNEKNKFGEFFVNNLPLRLFSMVFYLLLIQCFSKIRLGLKCKSVNSGQKSDGER